MDVVVTVPQSFGLIDWIDEGDAAGEPWSGEEWDFYLAGMRPNIKPGERVYVVYNGALRGYAPLMRLDTPADSHFVRRRGASAFSLVRGGGAVAVTVPEYIQGFRGWRYRWWDRVIEVPFPDWQDPWALAPGIARPPRAKPVTNPVEANTKGSGEREPVMASSKRHEHKWGYYTTTHDKCVNCGKVRRSPDEPHKHDWQPWGADTRYQRCECGEVRRVPDAEPVKAEARG